MLRLFISLQEKAVLGRGMLDSSKTVQEAPMHCSWCIIETESSSIPRLMIRGAHYCSRSCYLAENYEKFRNAAIFTILFAFFFPYIILAPYPGDPSHLLGNFATFYVVFGVGFLILFFLADRARKVRMTRPKKSRIGA